jgi:hypothetical protein
MPPRAHCRGDLRACVLAVLALSTLSGCSSVGDLGRLQPYLASDGIHDWVGRDAARSAGAPVSNYNLTEDERRLRDLAFPLECGDLRIRHRPGIRPRTLGRQPGALLRASARRVFPLIRGPL